MSLVIAACSSRKSQPAEACARAIPSASLDQFGKQWLSSLANAPRHVASSLYGGRSAREAGQSARSLNGELVYASAGLGWVSAKAEIPSYSLTVAPGCDDVLDRLNDVDRTTQWWSWICERSPYSSNIFELATSTVGPIVVALPRRYLEMVGPSLLELGQRHGDRLRIIGRQRTGGGDLGLSPWTIDYDDRLDAPESGRSGTLSDFAARGARHFIEAILLGHEHLGIIEHRALVDGALGQWVAPKRIAGRRLSDSDVKHHINQEWAAANGRSTKILRILRDELGVACEQGRFKRLAASVRAEMEETIA